MSGFCYSPPEVKKEKKEIMTKYIGCENAKSASAKLVEDGVTTYYRYGLDAQRYIISHREKKIAWFRKKNNRWVETEYWF